MMMLQQESDMAYRMSIGGKRSAHRSTAATGGGTRSTTDSFDHERENLRKFVDARLHDAIDVLRLHCDLLEGGGHLG